MNSSNNDSAVGNYNAAAFNLLYLMRAIIYERRKASTGIGFRALLHHNCIAYLDFSSRSIYNIAGAVEYLIARLANLLRAFEIFESSEL
jgi:hypothetical protein